MSTPSQNGARSPARKPEEQRLREAMKSLRRHWMLTLGVPVIVLAATAVFLFMVTPVYQQATSIRIDEKKSEVPMLDAEKVLPQLNSGNPVQTEMEVLGSRVIAEQVVDSLGLQLVLQRPRRTLRRDVFAAIVVDRETPEGDYTLERQADGRFRVEVKYEPDDDPMGLRVLPHHETAQLGEYPAGEAIPLRGGGAVRLTEAASRRETIRFHVDKFQDAVEDFQKHVAVSRPSREADVMVATHTGPDPELVRDATNAIAHAFLVRRQEVSSSEARSTVGFLRAQIDTLAAQLATSEDALRDYRQAALVIAPEAEATAQMKRLAEMQATRDGLAAEQRALQQMLVKIESETPTAAGDSSAYRRLIAFPTLFKNPAASELLGQLAEVENERAKLLNRRTMQDVDVQVLSQRIAEIEHQLRTLATTYLQGLGDQVTSLDTTLSGYRGELERIPQRDITFGRLLRRTKVLNDIYITLQNRLKEAEMKVAVNDPSARVVDPAIRPDKPVKPNIPVSLGFALLLGVVLGAGAAVGRDAMDTTVRTRDDLQEELGVTVLGSIPRIETLAPDGRRRFGVRVRERGGQVEPRLVSREDPRSPFAEAYRALRTNITFAVPDHRPRTLVFTSAMPGDGKSTTASNLAITLAQQDLHVLLVDADMRRGGLHELFGLERAPGLSQVIQGGIGLEEAIQHVDLDEHGDLDFLATGLVPPNPAELLGSSKMKRLLEEWQQRYEMVILDAPPLNVVTDAAILGTHADGVLVVARSGITDRGAVAYALEQLHNVRAPVLGTVLNDLDLRRDSYGGSAAAYAYYYGGSEG